MILGKLKTFAVVVCTIAGLLAWNSPAVGQTGSAQPTIQQVQLGNGVELHYVELGEGEPVVFVHGSLSDGSFWNPQLRFFGEKYHVIAYSRRYNQPNVNKPMPGYSAVGDADDLAGLIKRTASGQSPCDWPLIRRLHCAVPRSPASGACAIAGDCGSTSCVFIGLFARRAGGTRKGYPR